MREKGILLHTLFYLKLKVRFSQRFVDISGHARSIDSLATDLQEGFSAAPETPVGMITNTRPPAYYQV